MFANHHLTPMIQHYHDFGLLMQARLQTQSKCGGYNYSSSQHLAQSLEPSLMLNQFAKNLPHPSSILLSQKSLRTVMSSPMLTAQQSSVISLYFVCSSLCLFFFVFFFGIDTVHSVTPCEPWFYYAPYLVVEEAPSKSCHLLLPHDYKF